MAHKRPNVVERLDVQVGNRGRLVLPSKVRKSLGIREGDRMILTVEPDGSLRLAARREQVKQAQGMFQRVAPAVSLAGDLIQERRREAAQENSS